MKFNDFVFANELKQELKFFDEHPEEIRRALCFHGLPGIGKTSFANYLAYKHSRNTPYHVDCSSESVGARKHPIFVDWRRCVGHGGCSFNDENKNKHFTHAVIFDEWHDLTIKQQHNWKIPFDEIFENHKILIIICLNTSNEHDTESKKQRLNKLMARAIRSRCEEIEFSPMAGNENEIINGFMRRYPKANEEKMCDAYPDLRDMTAIGERSKRFSK